MELYRATGGGEGLKEKIGILGAGNGGQTLAGHLALEGHEVTLFQLPVFSDSVQAIRERGTIRLTGALDGEAPVRVTDKVEEAVQEARFVFVVVPAFGQIPMFRQACPYLKDGVTVVFVPGNLASVMALKIMKEEAYSREISFVETDTLPYACRLKSPGESYVWGMKKRVGFASCPMCRRESNREEDLQGLFPFDLVPFSNVLEISLSNMNMVIHSMTMLLNAGRIESGGGNFRFYTDGVTPTVGRMLELLDRERLAVGEAYGFELVSAAEWVKKAYALPGDSLYELLSENPVYARHGTDAPKCLDHRYVTEDVPNLLVPFEDLAQVAGVAVPIASSLITLWSAALGVDFREQGRTLTSMGLKSPTVQGVLHLVGGGGMTLGKR